MIIKHHCKLTDDETFMQIQENMYMQYFSEFSSFNTERPFDSSLFVEFRKRLNMEDVQVMTKSIAGIDSDRELRDVNLADTNLMPFT